MPASGLIMMIKKIIRVNRADSAFVYAILESLEGFSSYSTLDPPADETFASNYRDLELHIPTTFEAEMNEILEGLQRKITVLTLTSEQRAFSN